MTDKKPSVSFTPLKRAVKQLFIYYPKMAVVVFVLVLFAAAVAAIPSYFTQNLLTCIEEWYLTGDYISARPEIVRYLVILAVLFVLAIIASFIQSQLMAIMTQGYLDNLRKTMFNGMQKLPIRYFDTHKHGEIMSRYTNDTDTLRQLISQTLPTLLKSILIVIIAFGMMLYFSVWLTLIPVVSLFLMLIIAKKFGGGSAKYFLKMQKSLASTEGYIQEMMSGQKVVKVFNHQDQSIEDFDAENEALYNDAWVANAYANTMGPIFGNISNILYVIVAFVGGVLILTGVENVSFSGLPMDITVVIPFLGMVRQFTSNVNMVSQQINTITMAAAGATRLFELIDELPEDDNGTITLVNTKVSPDGTVTESEERTESWAWKKENGDGSITLTELKGDVRLKDVDFAYVEGKQILYDVSVYADPGQKVAFVGATGAGKTTITNLINRFYDIADGKITYDGININDIKKHDLRTSLGLVLQDTNLFTGSVMDNIRYGRLDASDEECIQAAQLAGADDFITRLPEGYDTMLTNNGSNLSQGQRQLLAIARAAVADPPVMILDEATSSIDTHTELIVQRGMDKLMEGRTVFVIAHRLSTVMDSDVIMVLDHGRIIERGSHDKLIEEKGTYYKLYTGSFELE